MPNMGVKHLDYGSCIGSSGSPYSDLRYLHWREAMSGKGQGSWIYSCWLSCISHMWVIRLSGLRKSLLMVMIYCTIEGWGCRPSCNATAVFCFRRHYLCSCNSWPGLWQVTDLIQEYFSSGDQAEALTALEEADEPELHHYFVKRLLTIALDKHDHEREMASVLLSTLYSEVISNLNPVLCLYPSCMANS